MDLMLQDKTVLVTGSTAGIGYAIAELLAREGATVIVNGRSKERVDDAVKQLRARAGQDKVTGIAADLATAAGCDALVAAAPHVDVLVNNMGIFEPKAFPEISDGDWLRFFETNVMSGVRLARAYLPGMLKKNWGRIIFISSESGVQIPVEMIHYGMTKSAQLSVSRGLAEMTKGTGVTVNCVLPGPTASEGVATFVDKVAAEQGKSTDEMEREFFDFARPTSLLRRFIKVEEVASMVAYVASPLSAATNGAALRVDGGVVRSMVG